MSEWYEIDAAWDADGYASDALLKLGETGEWCDLMDEVARSTHATAEEAYDGMANALRDYIESLDGQDVTGSIERVAESPEMLHDTREKLEDDVRTYMFPWRVDMALEWLDRQASITERECLERAAKSDWLGQHLRAVMAENAELNAQLADAQEALDMVWGERDQWRDAYKDSERMRLELVVELEKRDKGIRRLKQRRGELMEQVRQLQDDAARGRREA